MVTCPKCKKEMENLGNIDAALCPGYPSSCSDVYICKKCKLKQRVLVKCKPCAVIDYSFLEEYDEIFTLSKKEFIEILDDIKKEDKENNS